MNDKKRATFFTHARAEDGAVVIARKIREAVESHAGFPPGVLFDDEPQPADIPGMKNYRITVEEEE